MEREREREGGASRPTLNQDHLKDVRTTSTISKTSGLVNRHLVPIGSDF